jgi:hypothetical protein
MSNKKLLRMLNKLAEGLLDHNEACFACGENPDSAEAVKEAGDSALRMVAIYDKYEDPSWQVWAFIAEQHADQYQFLLRLQPKDMEIDDA